MDKSLLKPVLFAYFLSDVLLKEVFHWFILLKVK